MKISVLFAQSDSIYKTFADCDVWDSSRQALLWDGVCPVVAHPPCRAWSILRGLANPPGGEKELALFAVAQVRKFGGVLEHPQTSSLWKAPELGFAPVGRQDQCGGVRINVPQFWFGHRAMKKTCLYIVGLALADLPEIPFKLGDGDAICGGSRLRLNPRPEISKREREATPIDFAKFLVEIARRCKK